MIHLLDGAKHLWPGVLAPLDALQIAPGLDAGFAFESSFKIFGKCPAVGSRVRDEDCLWRGLHRAKERASITSTGHGLSRERHKPDTFREGQSI